MAERSVLATACHPDIVRRSVIMAAVVGPILTLINQGDALVSDAPFSLWKAGLTFVVPYLVATLSAVATRHGRHAADTPDACHDGGARLGSADLAPCGPAERSDPSTGTRAMKARVHVTLKPGVLDPQGKAIAGALASLGFDGVGEVRQGKVIDLEIAGADRAEARSRVEAMCQQLLANTVIEDYAIDLEA
jgi:phosphoribosylformylglycinamidine synthase subunit PurS